MFVLVTVQSSTYLVVLPDPRPVSHTALHRGVCGGAVLQSKSPERRDRGAQECAQSADVHGEQSTSVASGRCTCVRATDVVSGSGVSESSDS